MKTQNLNNKITILGDKNMERPKLRYAYNEALINTYAEELEKYCDELEKISSTLSKSFSESMFKLHIYEPLNRTDQFVFQLPNDEDV